MLTMFFASKKASLLTLGITAILGSGWMLHSFDDPEGPNLLIIVVMAAVIYMPSLVFYWFNFLDSNFKRFGLAVLTQITVVAGLYYFLS